MQTVILAAGMGKRLKELTKNHTKCMVEINGKTLIERAVDNIEKAGINRIIIVTGYQGEALREYVSRLNLNADIVFINNDKYEETNNIYSLWLAKDYLAEDDTIVLESDIIFEEGLIERLMESDEECVTFVARPQPWMDGTIVKLDKNSKIVEFIDSNSYDMNNINEYYKKARYIYE
jgi:choline kinase